jgi:hypothetical protein
MGLLPDTKLIDIPLEKLPILLLFQDTIKDIPKRLVPIVRSAYVQTITDLLNARAKDDTQEELKVWKELFLIPVALLSSHHQRTIRQRAQMVLKRDWSNLTIKLFFAKAPRPKAIMDNFNIDLISDDPYETFDNNNNYKRVQQASDAGDLSKAFQLLTADFKLLKPTDTVFDKLDEKFPKEAFSNAAPADPDLSPEQLEDNPTEQHPPQTTPHDNDITTQIQPDPTDPTITSKHLAALIHKLRPCAKPGIDKLRHGYLKQMIRGNNTTFVDQLAKVIDILVKGLEPPQISKLLSTNELIAGDKPNGGVRPIGIGFTLRKLTAMTINYRARGDFNEDHFKDRQFAMRKSGMEEIIHNVTTVIEKDKTLCVLTADGNNSFNQCNKHTGLKEIEQHYPFAYPHLRNMYAQDSECWFNMNNKIKVIQCKNGFHQGDVLGNWAYTMTIHPMLNELALHIKQTFPDSKPLINFYVDDGTFAAEYEIINEILIFLQREDIFQKYGYKLNPNKCSLLLGSCGDPELLKTRLEELTKTIPPDNIKTHPDDVTDDQISAQVKYGIKLLGSFIGSDEFIKEQLIKYVEEKIVPTVEKLKGYNDTQTKFLLFKHCLLTKPLYLFRTIRPTLLTDIIPILEKMQRDVIVNILECEPHHFSDTNFEQCLLRQKDGGLGMHKFEEIAPAAYVTSLLSWFTHEHFEEKYNEVKKRFDDKKFSGPDFQDLEPHLREFFFHLYTFDVDDKIVQFTNAGDDLTDPFIRMGAMRELRTGKETLQSTLAYTLAEQRKESFIKKLEINNKRHLQVFFSLQNSHSSAWLDARPTEDSFIMSNDVFQTALASRLYMVNSNVRKLSVSTCNCSRQIDLHGNHFITGCPCNNASSRPHNAVQQSLLSIIRYSGYRCLNEEYGLFHSSINPANNRPDISILNPGTLATDLESERGTTKLLIDVSITKAITVPITGEVQPSLRDARNTGLATINVFKKKWNQYAAIFNKLKESDTTQKLGIIPFIMLTTGLIHNKSLLLLKSLAETASITHDIPKSVMFHRFKKIVSCALQRGIADAISVRCKFLNSKT